MQSLSILGNFQDPGGYDPEAPGSAQGDSTLGSIQPELSQDPTIPLIKKGSKDVFQTWVQDNPSSGCYTSETIPHHRSNLTYLPQNTPSSSHPPTKGTRLMHSCSATLCAGVAIPPQGPSWLGHAVSRKPLKDAKAGELLWLWVEEGNSLVSDPGALKGPVALASTFTGRLSSNGVHSTDNEQTLPWLCLVSPESHLNSQCFTVSSWLSPKQPNWNAWKISDGSERTCKLHSYSKVHTPWELHSGTILNYIMDYFCLQKQVTNNGTK